MNWTREWDGTPNTLQLEAIWPVGNEWKRELQSDEIVSLEETEDFGDSKELRLCFSWPEFVLVGMHLQYSPFYDLRLNAI
jgi:hypothetical protein